MGLMGITTIKTSKKNNVYALGVPKKRRKKRTESLLKK